MRIVMACLMALGLTLAPAEAAKPKSKQAVAAEQTVAKKKVVGSSKKKTVATLSRPVLRAERSCSGFFECLFGGPRRGGYGRATRERVEWSEAKYRPGSIIVRTPERALYYVLP